MSKSANDVRSLKIKSEAMATLEPLADQLMARHKEKRRLWFPGDFLPANEQMTDEQARDMAELPERARGMPDAVRVALALNLLTEEGLPHFHRLLAVTMGSDNAWSRWNYMWTAEEDRHGCALHDYVRDARLFDMRAFEALQYQYIEAGFDPESSGDPYQIMAYTTLQERATQAAHANTARVAGRHEPIIQRLLARVANDESRHFRFYRDIFRGILEIDCTRAAGCPQGSAAAGHARPYHPGLHGNGRSGRPRRDLWPTPLPQGSGRMPGRLENRPAQPRRRRRPQSPGPADGRARAPEPAGRHSGKTHPEQKLLLRLYLCAGNGAGLMRISYGRIEQIRHSATQMLLEGPLVTLYRAAYLHRRIDATFADCDHFPQTSRTVMPGSSRSFWQTYS
jgi:hypothetical protein